MLAVYCTIQDKIVQNENNLNEKGTWINLINPSEEELALTAKATGIDYDYLKHALDDEERPRIETENNQLLIIINIPVILNKQVIYDTIPLGIILTDDHFVTVCLDEVEILKDFSLGKIKGLATFKKTRFLFQILYQNATFYLKLLRDIEKRTNEIELRLHKSLKNKELINLLNLQKSLVYFTTSLKSNEKVMQKLLRSKTLKMYEEDQELLEDVIVENKQAVEMAETYSNISSSMMDAFASVISNNLNIVMKFLTAVTIILALPTMVASFFGMNVQLPFQRSPYGFSIIVGICVLLCASGIAYLSKRDMF